MTRSKTIALTLAFFAAAGLTACDNNGSEEVNWSSHGNTYDEQRFSPLAQITADNVADIGLDWELSFDDVVQFAATPLAIDGVLYFTSDRSIVYAVDGRSGNILWRYNPEVYKHGPRQITLGWNTNRGLAHLDGTLYLGSTDGRLIAIDRDTGKEIWAVRTFPEGDNRAITGAPRAFKDLVVIGHGGADSNARGYVTAYDAKTGEQRWRFYLVPGNPAEGFENAAMEMAAKTWSGKWWEVAGGGGTVWHAINYDPELNQIYLGTGNGSVWSHLLRSEGKGDNLFLGSIVALDADTGDYKWHYQVMPEEAWDYNAAMDIIAAELEIDGAMRKVVMQAPKNGFFYVIDRETGKFISADKFTKSNWADYIDSETGRPVLGEAADYLSGPKHLYPSPLGGHNWHAMSFSPKSGLSYIPEMQIGAVYSQVEMPDMRPNFLNTGVLTTYPEVDPRDGKGSLVAWDPVTQTARWTVKYESFWNGGTLATAGDLVFQGTGSGMFIAYNADNGDKLWEIDVQRGVSAAPISYTIDGKQHVAILAGYGGLASFGIPAMTKEGWRYKAPGIRLLSFSLDGKQELTRVDDQRHSFYPVDLGDIKIDKAAADRGVGLYHNSSCAVCHGGEAVSSGAGAPDLRESASMLNFESFKAIVQGGMLLEKGMPRFDDLNDQEIKDVYAYLQQQTQLASKRAQAK